jgi:hypothetical protein
VVLRRLKKTAVQPAFDLSEHLVRANFGNLAVVHDSDEVGISDGRQAVGNDDRRPWLLPHKRIERVLHHPLALAVKRAGGLVEEKDGRIADDCPCDGDALLLPPRELPARGSDIRVELVGEL